MPEVKSPLRLVLFLFAIVAKFWLIWATEITDAIDDPHEYVLQVLIPVNGGLSYPPGTGLVGGFFREFGVPFRLGIEAAFILATVLVLRALFTWPWKSWLPFGLFVFVTFDPAIAELFSHFYSDQVWLVETMLGLACFVLAFRSVEKLDWTCVYAALSFFGFSIITRSVMVPLLISVMVFALVALVLSLSKGFIPNLKRKLDFLALTVPTFIFGLSLIYGSMCRYNLVKHGYTGLSYIDSSQYKNFYLCLQSVGDPDGPRYFPIDENRRKLIALAGPDSSWLMRQLDDNTFYKQAGLDHYGRADIAAGWFHWAVFTAAMHDGNYIGAFKLFDNIEDEINASTKFGRVQVRAIAPLPDARIPIVIGALPSGLWNTVSQIVHEPPPDAFAAKDAATLYVNPDFTKALTRRAVTDSPFRDSLWQILAHIYAWIYTPVLFALYIIALAALKITILRRWKQIPEFYLFTIAQYIFSIVFVILILWYTLFDASGMPATARYMIFNHVLMPMLICSYAVGVMRLRMQAGGLPVH